LVEAVGYLLEKDGKVFEAFDLMFEQFKIKLNQVVLQLLKICIGHETCYFTNLLHFIVFKVIEEAENESDSRAVTSNLSWTQLQALFLVIIQFSQRNSPKLVSDEREKLWMPLLELVISAYNRFQGRKSVSADFNDMAKHLLSSMMGHVSLPTIVEIVMNDPSYQKATFAEVRNLVMGERLLQVMSHELLVKYLAMYVLLKIRNAGNMHV